MASTVTRKRARTPARTSLSRDARLKELMKQAVREVLQEMDDDWDRQMTADVEAGKLDSLIEEARAEIRAGKTAPMDLRRR